MSTNASREGVRFPESIFETCAAEIWVLRDISMTPINRLRLSLSFIRGILAPGLAESQYSES